MIRLTQIGAVPTARLAIRRQRGGTSRDKRQACTSAAAVGAAHEQQRAALPYPADGALADGENPPDVCVKVAVRPLAG